MIYQIDFSAASSGKVVSMTKRRVRWRWGIANQKALDAGKVGVDCRGYEHEVTFIWSITSGKKLVVEDGKEVHFTVGRRAEGRFQHSWTGWNNHIFTIIAYASPPLKPRPGFQQFELLIDGMSFNSFPRIYELEKGHSDVFRPSTSQVEYRSDRETVRSSREEDMQWAQKVHRLESQRMMNYDNEPENNTPSPTVSLLDMEFASSSIESSTLFTSESTFDQYDYNHPSQPPSYEAVWSSIMDAYDTNETGNAVVTEPDMAKLQIDTSLPNAPSKETLSSNESPRDVTDIDGVLKNLVNLDDLSAPVFQGYTKKDSELNMMNSTRSLSELKSMQKETNSAPTREIMKNHQNYAEAHPGAVVVYGQPTQGYNNYVHNPQPLFGTAYTHY